MANIKLKNREGQDVNYNGIESITVPDQSGNIVLFEKAKNPEELYIIGDIPNDISAEILPSGDNATYSKVIIDSEEDTYNLVTESRIEDLDFEGVTLGSYAFAGCNYVRNITNISNFPEGLFYKCSDVDNVELNLSGVINIPSYAFYGCSNFSNFYIYIGGENINGIGPYAFAYAGGGFGWWSAYSIGTYAFYHASIDDNIYLNNASSIGGYAFAGTNITSVQLSNCRTIGINAFAECENLTDFLITSMNSSTFTLNSLAFGSSNNIHTLSFPDFGTTTRIVTITADASVMFPNIGTIYVPSSKLSRYLANSRWATVGGAFIGY